MLNFRFNALIKKLFNFGITLFIFLFLLNNVFAEVIYVKKKGDDGPPPEKISQKTQIDNPKKNSTQNKNSNSKEKNAPQEEYSLPDKTPLPQNQKESHKQSYIYSGNKDSKSVALTFDDGPNLNFTPKLLTILKEKNVKATFFLLGEQVKLFPSQAKAIADEGHEIATHSFTHPNLSKASKEIIEKEINDSQDIVEKETGIKAKLFRPPYGNSNATVVEICKKAGIDYIIFWSVDTNDWKTNSTKESIVEKTLKEAKGGSIILLHDRFTKSIEAVPVIIDKLREKGYNFVTVGELLKEQ